MSTTVTVSPAVTTPTSPNGVLLPLALVGAGLWAVARAIAAQDETCARLLAQSRADLRQERLATLELRSVDLARLARSAREARFFTSALPGGSLRLRAEQGHPVWAMRTPTGIQLLGGEAAMHRLLIANTTSRAAEALRANGFQVVATQNARGRVGLVGKGVGRQVVTVSVGGSGEARMDLQGFQGKACEGIVRNLATAMEGTVTDFRLKPEYHSSAPVTVGGKAHA
jgi:hypothetical protein